MTGQRINPVHSPNASPSVGIIGGGIAGSTIAMRLAELGINVELFEEGPSLVNGPPICHLHAGGNLYREISDEQCITLLKQSIDTLKVFPHAANIRPTVIAVPQHDAGEPEALLPRLKQLQQTYSSLVCDDSSNRLLGEPDDYFRLYDREAMESLSQLHSPVTPSTLDDWMIPVAKNIPLDNFKFPFVLVQEYGLSVFRLAASAALSLGQLPTCHVHTRSHVTHVHQAEGSTWEVDYLTSSNSGGDPTKHLTTRVDYLVNACGFRTGTIDDMAHLTRQRMVEFKAAYVTQWPECEGAWPEVIFHGERGTPDGMAQLTPYPGGYFQLHGMTEDITLFRDGLVASADGSAQPVLDDCYVQMLTTGWEKDDVNVRTQRAIDHMARFVPRYTSAVVAGKPLFGAQQIPGDDATLRAADVSFDGERYARAEIVKASSALSAADCVLGQLVRNGLFSLPEEESDRCAAFPVTQSLTAEDVELKAVMLAKERGYPTDLAQPLIYSKP